MHDISTQIHKRNKSWLLSKEVPSDIFTASLQPKKRQKSLKGDCIYLHEPNATHLDKISKNQIRLVDRKALKQLLLFHNNKNLFTEPSTNNINHNIKPITFETEDEEDVNSLGEKMCNNPMRRLSSEFLAKLYNQGTTTSSSTESDFEKKKILKINSTISPNHPFIYSYTEHHPFSFFYGNKTFCYNNNKKNNQLLVPAPTFLSSELWMKRPDLSKEGIFEGMKITDKQAVVLVDPKIMVKFRGIMGNMVKQVLLAALGNKISLLIRLFEPKSVLQRIADFWGFANQFLIKAANPQITPLERMKLVISLGVSGLYIPTKQLKPFNPLLGETFQGEIETGGKVYCEHVSHRPLISRILIMHDKYMITGFFEYTVRPENLGSVIYCFQKGPITVSFPALKETIIYNVPTIKLLNAKSEKERAAMWANNMNFVDVKNNLRAIIHFGENHKKVHDIRGIIYHHKFSANYKFNYDVELENGKKLKLNRTNNYKVYAKISGSWLEKLVISDKVFWDINKMQPDWIRPIKSCLPSDGRFREDVIWLFRSFYCAKNEDERKLYEDIGQQWKVLMERYQRVERELRLKNKPKHKKKK